MKKYDVLIIGSGLGGLVCGSILSKQGMKVGVLEMDQRIGGTLQSFAKEGVMFNTGINYTESLGKGEILHRYFSYLGIMDSLKVQRLDMDAFDKISLGDEQVEYPFAQGHDHFIERLTEFFPAERQNLEKYIHQMREVCNSFPYYNLDSDMGFMKSLSSQASVSDFLKSCTPDPQLQKVLAGMNSLYAGVEGETPMYIHSLINYSFIKSAWRFVDGSSQLANLLAKGIKANGGDVFTQMKVVALKGKNNIIDQVCLENGEQMEARWVISNIHPASTLKLLPENMIRKSYTNRILSLKNSIGMFSLYLVLHKESLEQFNYNYHHFPHSKVWGTDYCETQWPEHFMMYSPANTKGGKYANGLIVLSYMHFEELRRWEHTHRSNRPREYHDFKEQKTAVLLKALGKRFPGIEKHIKSCYSSTPLSYRDYTGTPDGSAYGIMKKADNPLLYIVSPRSKVNNLLYAGQNTNMHGILGVTISSMLACQEIIGKEHLINEIRKF